MTFTTVTCIRSPNHFHLLQQNFDHGLNFPRRFLALHQSFEIHEQSYQKKYRPTLLLFFLFTRQTGQLIHYRSAMSRLIWQFSKFQYIIDIAIMTILSQCFGQPLSLLLLLGMFQVHRVEQGQISWESLFVKKFQLIQHFQSRFVSIQIQ